MFEILGFFLIVFIGAFICFAGFFHAYYGYLVSGRKSVIAVGSLIALIGLVVLYFSLSNSPILLTVKGQP